MVVKLHFAGLNSDFGYAQLREMLNNFTHKHFFLGGFVSVVFSPFAHCLALIISIPEAAIKHSAQSFVPLVFLFFGERAVENAGDSLLIAPHHGVNILWTACPTLDFEHAHARIHHLIDKANGL